MRWPSPPDEARAIRPLTALAMLALGAVSVVIALLARGGPGGRASAPAGDAPVVAAAFSPPSWDDIPDGPEGDAIRRGRAIFSDTRANAGQHVGNAMACRNCHTDEGRAPNAAPMWAAWVNYPQFRKKTGTINTMADRITQCFRFSMNAPNSPSGQPPAADSPIVADLETYFHWLAKGAPTGTKMAGGGFPKPALPDGGYDPARGATIFEARCSGCHGSDGQGAIDAGGKVAFPPLWGPKSYNWGAGMARVDLAAGFIRANMPQNAPGSLSDAEAWDVAAFIDSHERPRDPRQTGSVADNAAKNFKDQKSYYGQTVAGVLLGTGVPGQR